MPDYFETGFFGGNQEAWHGAGTVIPEDVVVAEEAIKLAGLDWEVVQIPLYAHFPDVEINGDVTGTFRGEQIPINELVANVRATDKRFLGAVGKGFMPVQNREAFAFMDDLLATGDAKYHTAGSLKNGKRIWMLARLNRDILIGGQESERIAPFIMLCNGHDGSMGLMVVVTPVRVVCWNTLSFALSSAKRMWYTRHTANIEDRMEVAQNAAETLGLSYKFFDRLEAVGNKLVEAQYTTAQFEKMLKRLIPLPKVNPDEGGRKVASRKQAQAAILDIFRAEPNLENVRETKWAAIQAVTQYEDHIKRIRIPKDGSGGAVERRFERAILNPHLKVRAMAYVAPEFVSSNLVRKIEMEEEHDEALVA